MMQDFTDNTGAKCSWTATVTKTEHISGAWKAQRGRGGGSHQTMVRQSIVVQFHDSDKVVGCQGNAELQNVGVVNAFVRQVDLRHGRVVSERSGYDQLP
jgi:hypothetical protein